MAGGTGLLNSGSNFVENMDLEIGAVEIKDGTTDQRATVDSNGNLHVYVANAAAYQLVNTFNQPVAAIPVSTPTTVVTYTVPAGKTFNVLGAVGSGAADGLFTLYINSTKVAKAGSSFQGRAVFFNFVEVGLPAVAGDVVRLEVENQEVSPPWSGSAFAYWGNIFGQLI